MSISRRRRAAGFTLTELMIVVIIIGVLAAIAIPAFSTYIFRVRAQEAPHFLAEIRARQEAYRAEFGRYAAVSGAGWGMFEPAAVPGVNPVSFVPTDEWRQLGARPDGVVRFQYATIAGNPATVPPGGLGYDGSDFWFVAQARGDLDGDGMAVTFEAYSAGNNVWVSEDKGWE